jgi:hypothetical protein
MPAFDLFLSLAEIAGVFVGFGALIAVRSGDRMAVSGVNDIRWVVTTGIWVVIVGLLPIIVSGYGLTDHELWLVCSLVALTVLGVMLVMFGRIPENRAELAETQATTRWTVIALWAAPTFWLPAAALIVALVLVALGLFPDQERALYLTAAALGLLMGALGLFVAVFWPSLGSAARTGPPASGDDDPAVQPLGHGSDASPRGQNASL